MTNEQFDKVIDEMVGAVAVIMKCLSDIKSDRKKEHKTRIDEFLDEIKEKHVLLREMLDKADLEIDDDGETIDVIYDEDNKVVYNCVTLPRILCWLNSTRFNVKVMLK